MMDAMFELPEQSKGVKYTVNEAVVRREESLFGRKRRRESA
jgi:hypothetical protein